MNRLEMSIVRNAIELAFKAHALQKRKYTDDPYTIHLAEVASFVGMARQPSGHMLAAAWLHDAVEDTDVTLEEIGGVCGQLVAIYVEALTDTPKEAGNRSRRKGLDRLRLSMAPPPVHTIKYADLLSNTASIVSRDPGFARLYLAEKRALLNVIKDGDPGLLNLAMIKLGEAEKQAGLKWAPSE